MKIFEVIELHCSLMTRQKYLLIDLGLKRGISGTEGHFKRTCYEQYSEFWHDQNGDSNSILLQRNFSLRQNMVYNYFRLHTRQEGRQPSQSF